MDDAVISRLIDELEPYLEGIREVTSIENLRGLLDFSFRDNFNKLSSFLTHSQNFNSVSMDATDEQLNELIERCSRDLRNLIAEARNTLRQI